MGEDEDMLTKLGLESPTAMGRVYPNQKKKKKKKKKRLTTKAGSFAVPAMRTMLSQAWALVHH